MVHAASHVVLLEPSGLVEASHAQAVLLLMYVGGGGGGGAGLQVAWQEVALVPVPLAVAMHRPWPHTYSVGNRTESASTEVCQTCMGTC